MKVSAKTRYAARILLALAGGYDNRVGISPMRSFTAGASSLKDGRDAALKGEAKPVPMNSHAVAEKTGVTVQFTEQILKALKRGGLTTSTRGAAGGHSLTRAPELITLGEVVRVMEGGVQLASCAMSKEICDNDLYLCERAQNCVMRNVWIHVTKALEDTLDSISLADLLSMDGTL